MARIELQALAVLVAVGAAGPAGATGPQACEIDRLLASDGAADDWFGYGVAVSGDTIIVGAPEEDENGDYAGAAYAFRFDGAEWTPEQKLLASGGAAHDWFGQAVAVSGNAALISAPSDQHDESAWGAAYVFRFNGSQWGQEQRLIPEGEGADSFSTALALDGNVALVGAPFAWNPCVLGTVYVFRYNGSSWDQEQQLLPSPCPDGDIHSFGRAVALDGTVAVAGAPEDDENGTNSGSAHVFRFNGSSWQHEQKLLASDGGAFDDFGEAVAVSGNVVVVGASGTDDNGSASGSVYVFRFNGASWVQAPKLLASDGTSGNDFGAFVAAGGDALLAGADESAYLFRFNGATWAEDQKLVSSDHASNDAFGWSVDLDGDLAVIGARLNDVNGSDSGSAYAYHGVRGLDCNTNGAADACDIADGTSPDVNANGIPDECEDLCPCDCEDPPDGTVDVGDFLALLAQWGGPGPCDCEGPPDGAVDVGDFLALLAGWGPCP
jgi:hypothetical protein